MKSSAHSSRSDGRKRYSAAVEKGENAWRREWGSFISNLTLKRVQDGYGSVTLRAGADLKRQAILERRALRYAADDSTAGTSQAVEDGSAAAQGGTPADASSHVGGKTEAAEEEVRGAMAATYSYLFNSPSERKAARAARQHTRQRARPGRTGGAHPDSDDEDEDGMGGPDAPTRLSKHQKALLEADRCGLVLHDMTRREKRDFLKLSVTRDQQAAQEWSKTLKLHELMDPKAAWYQQGPHPIDLIAEKLVRHKAVKRGKQLGLRYNYYLPHPSWLARRAQHRRESLLVGLGRRFVFDENGVMCDALRQTPVDPLHPRLLLVEDNAPVTAATSASESASPPAPPPSTSEQAAAAATESAQTVCAATTRALPDSSLLRDPRAMANSYVRAVVRNAEVAQSFHRANLTTNYLSPALVAGPNMHPQDAMLASAAAAAAPSREAWSARQRRLCCPPRAQPPHPPPHARLVLAQTR